MRGPWVAASYYELAADQAMDAGRLVSPGDIVTIDAAGYVKITDAHQDPTSSKSGGDGSALVDLEKIWSDNPKVAEAGDRRPHPRGTTAACAVVLKPGMSATAEELREYLAPKFASSGCRTHFVFLEAIPRTTTGKMLKAKLREQFKDWRWG